MFSTDMNNEYARARAAGFAIPELFQISLNIVDSAFLPDEEKMKLRANFHEGIDRKTGDA